MRLTTRGRFAVTAMLDLALRHESKPIALSAISERQGISQAYLEQLFNKLKRAKLVDSVRGAGGGYLLAKTPAEISIADIIAAVDEPLDATQCGGHENCRHNKDRCLTHKLWTGLNQTLLAHLSAISLQNLLEEHGDFFQSQAT